MRILLIITVLSLLVSLLFDRKKTWMGIKKGLKMFLNILLPFISVLIIVSLILAALPKETIVKWLGDSSGPLSYLVAALTGSVSLIPGFIAYPLGRVLLDTGVSYSIIAIFITTLMMVGIVTLPLEIKYFGWKAAVIRNALSFIGAVIIGLGIGFIWKVIA